MTGRVTHAPRARWSRQGPGRAPRMRVRPYQGCGRNTAERGPPGWFAAARVRGGFRRQVATRAMGPNYRDDERVRDNPDLLASAVAAGYLTYRTGDDGQPKDIRLAPDVAFSLNIATNLHDSYLLPPPTQRNECELSH
jgi:hypothetical protein